MFFALLRFYPVVFTLLQIIVVRLLISTGGGWYWYLALLMSLDLIYFILLKIKLQSKHTYLLALHSLVVLSSGYAFILMISGEVFLTMFVLIWSGIVLIYLESVFHYCYQSRKQVLFNLSNVVSYTNLISFFVAIAAVFNLYIFLEISGWWVVGVTWLVSSLLLMNYYLIHKISWRTNLITTAVLSLLLVEIVSGLIFWPVSFYVLTLILTIGYYIFSSLSLMYLQEKLTFVKVWQYLAFSFLLIGVTLLTTIWL